MALNLSLLYRGPLSSCNYDCSYCPFAKRHETAAQLRVDREALERFEDWCADQTCGLSILFTPWGEGLTRRWYQRAFQNLSALKHLHKVAIQTNLAADLQWLQTCDLSKVGLWCTFHPSQTTIDRFLGQCGELNRMGVRYSVGVVGLREHYGLTEQLRECLPDDVYLWVNAYKDERDYYTTFEESQWTEIDPLFPMNNVRHASAGRSCQAGRTVLSIDGKGDARRCHFIPEKLGNIYQQELADILQESPCTRETCGCHIGYVHLDHLKLYETFGPEGILDRTLGADQQHELALSRRP